MQVEEEQKEKEEDKEEEQMEEEVTAKEVGEGEETQQQEEKSEEKAEAKAGEEKEETEQEENPPKAVKEEDTFTPIQQASTKDKVHAPRPPSSQSSCDVVVMVGLPASGKTTWAQKFCRDQSDKNYEILGSDLILDKMGLGRVGWRENYETLLKQSSEILNNMLVLASESMRNFVIDQVNRNM